MSAREKNAECILFEFSISCIKSFTRLSVIKSNYLLYRGIRLKKLAFEFSLTLKPSKQIIPQKLPLPTRNQCETRMSQVLVTETVASTSEQHAVSLPLRLSLSVKERKSSLPRSRGCCRSPWCRSSIRTDTC